ncbi:hypothetical protein BXY66_1543 [Shimia isoporae]|uniref:Uncharacterized protein n=2 Tax=Shimia isoporae TaxID=647720 RepID=A0A4R1NMF4_9RHOB|nr:hypothetical protein BXY66_1543 [Shimia isoporae]
MSQASNSCNRSRIFRFFTAILLLVLPNTAATHTSEGGFVLLLPTDVYIVAGGLSVALTVLALFAVPAKTSVAFFRPVGAMPVKTTSLPIASSCGSAVILFCLFWVGIEGPRDPLANPLPLAIWTVWWIGLVVIQGTIGNVWTWIDPWSGPLFLARRFCGMSPIARLPTKLGKFPAIALFLCFSGFLLADIAPSDPARLARLVGLYWGLTLFGALIFGDRWRVQGDPIGLLMRSYGRMAILGRRSRSLAFGFPGWQVFLRRNADLGTAVFVIVLLGSGSFDGLNETFWWLSLLGLNPLEFPGRSAVVWQTMTGLLISNGLLLIVFGGCVWLGLNLAKSQLKLRVAVCLFAPTLLPIALAYHFAHYFTVFLVEAQYALAAASDPWATGRDLLGLGTYYVTTGFFNTPDSVRVLWLTQAGSVVFGHIVAIALAHAVAVRAFGSGVRATLSQVPLAVFMVGFTIFGLWLLASPRGL